MRPTTHGVPNHTHLYLYILYIIFYPYNVPANTPAWLTVIDGNKVPTSYRRQSGRPSAAYSRSHDLDLYIFIYVYYVFLWTYRVAVLFVLTPFLCSSRALIQILICSKCTRTTIGLIFEYVDFSDQYCVTSTILEKRTERLFVKKNMFSFAKKQLSVPCWRIDT